MNIVGGIDVIQLSWLAIALAIWYWLVRIGAGLLAKSQGPLGSLGSATLKVIPGG